MLWFVLLMKSGFQQQITHYSLLQTWKKLVDFSVQNAGSIKHLSHSKKYLENGASVVNRMFYNKTKNKQTNKQKTQQQQNIEM